MVAVEVVRAGRGGDDRAGRVEDHGDHQCAGPCPSGAGRAGSSSPRPTPSSRPRRAAESVAEIGRGWAARPGRSTVALRTSARVPAARFTCPRPASPLPWPCAPPDRATLYSSKPAPSRIAATISIPYSRPTTSSKRSPPHRSSAGRARCRESGIDGPSRTRVADELRVVSVSSASQSEMPMSTCSGSAPALTSRHCPCGSAASTGASSAGS